MRPTFGWRHVVLRALAVLADGLVRAIGAVRCLAAAGLLDKLPPSGTAQSIIRTTAASVGIGGFNRRIIALCAPGMTTRDIRAQLR